MKNKFLTLLFPAMFFAPHVAFAANAPFNWSGWYAGANLGISYNSYDYDDMDGWGGGYGDRNVVNAIGFQPGIRGGYNWQINHAILGIEADYNGNIDAGEVFDAHNASSNSVLTEKGGVTSYGTLRGRAGALIGDDILAYLTAGAVYARDNQRVDYDINYTPQYHIRWQGADNQYGLVFGLGGEFALTEHMSMSGEFLQALFLQDQVHGTCVLGNCSNITTSYRYGMEPDMSVLRVGLNWHFD